MMKVLIVGGNSSLGNSLKKFFSGFSEVITAGRKNCDLTFDLKDPISMIQLPENMDAVIHTAAQFGIRSDEEILDTEDVNVLGTLKLCQAAVQANAKHFILISSIYSSLKRNVNNYNIYTLSKKHAEEVAHLYCTTHSLPLTVLKPSPLYGNEESFRVHQPFFYTIVDKAERGEDIALYGSNDAIRNYLHVDDLSEVIVRVIVKKIHGSYSCTYTTDVTYSQIARAALEAFKSVGKVYFLKDKPDIPNNIFEKDFSIHGKIDFYPQISIEEGLRRLADKRTSIK